MKKLYGQELGDPKLGREGIGVSHYHYAKEIIDTIVSIASL
jgi:hypothetical protein